VTLSLSLVSSERRLLSAALNARQSWSSRAACVITLESDAGVRGMGEAAPLPGFSPDTLVDCHAALAALDTTILPASPTPGQAIVEQLAHESSRLPSGVPAARAALEAALLDLWARAAGKPAWALLLEPGAIPKPRAVSGLLMGEPEHAIDDARRAQARGLQTFKLKIGRPAMIERELAVARRLRETLGAAARLRLDANQSFTARQAQECLPRFAEHGIELVEEPCALAELGALGAALPLAWDESLLLLASESLAKRAAKVSGARALVLKPAVLGGVSACYAWAQIGAQIGAEVILSHTFDGPLGLALSATLALSIGSDSLAQGLDVEGARLETSHLAFFSGTHIQAWSEPGFGLRQADS
jgi:o-succinylbenzoate synthase